MNIAQNVLQVDFSNGELLSNQEELALRKARVAVAGVGGVGGIHLITLANSGIRNFNVIDPDNFELANFNRQFGARVSSLGKSKVETMASMITDQYRHAKLNVWEDYLNEENIDSFLEDVDVVVDGLDAFAIEARRLLCMRAYEKGIPVVAAGPLGFSAALLIFHPKGMSFDTYFGFNPELSVEEKLARYFAGVAPRPHFLRYMNTSRISFNGRTGPSTASAVTLCAALVSISAIKLILGRGKVCSVPQFHYYDPYLHRYIVGRGGNYRWSPLRRLLTLFIRKNLERNAHPAERFAIPISSVREAMQDLKAVG